MLFERDMIDGKVQERIFFPHWHHFFVGLLSNKPLSNLLWPRRTQFKVSPLLCCVKKKETKQLKPNYSRVRHLDLVILCWHQGTQSSSLSLQAIQNWWSHLKASGYSLLKARREHFLKTIIFECSSKMICIFQVFNFKIEICSDNWNLCRWNVTLKIAQGDKDNWKNRLLGLSVGLMQ